MANPSISNLSRHILAAALFVPGIAVSAAAEVDFDLAAGIGRSDNISRAVDGKDAATIGSVGVRFDAAKASLRLDSTASADIELLKYFGNSYSSEIMGVAAGRARVALVESRLHWTIEDSFGQNRLDIFSAPSPANRENVNYFSTGPDVLLPLGDSMNLRAGGRYARVDYQDSPADSERFGGSLGLEREISSAAIVSVNAQQQRIKPRDDILTPEYDYSSAYLRYAHTGARSSIAIDAGANRVKGDAVKDSGALVRLELRRQLGAYSQVSVQLGNEFTDSGADFGQRVGSAGEGGIFAGDASVQQAAPYVSRHANFAWNVSGRRTSFGVSAGWYDEDYELDALDRRRHTFGLRASRRVAPRTSVSGGVRYDRYTFDAPAADDNDDLVYDAALTWRAGPRVSLDLAGERSEFSSDADDRSATEMRYWLRLRYSHRDPSR